MKSVRLDRPGGSILFETGPHSIRPSSVGGLATIELLQQLGMTDQPIFTHNDDITAEDRYFKYQNQLVLVKTPKTWLGKIRAVVGGHRLIRECVMGGLRFIAFPRWGPKGMQDESIGSFMGRMTNETCRKVLLSAIVHGVYAGDVDRLSMRSTFFKPVWKMYLARKLLLKPPNDDAPLAYEMKANINPSVLKTALDSIMYTFPDGTETLPRRLFERLQKDGRVTMKLDSPVQAISAGKGGEIKIRSTLQSRTFSHVVSTMPLPKLFPLLPYLPRDLAASFPAPVTVAVVNLYYSPNSVMLPIQGFGYLIPKTEDNPEDALGVIFASGNAEAQDKGPWAKGTKLTVMMGGHYWRDRNSFPSDDELLAAAKAVVGRDLGITTEPAASLVSLQRECIPQYEVGHWERVEKLNGYLDETFGKDRFMVVGSAVDGVAVGDCVLSGRKAAKRLQEMCYSVYAE